MPDHHRYLRLQRKATINQINCTKIQKSAQDSPKMNFWPLYACRLLNSKSPRINAPTPSVELPINHIPKVEDFRRLTLVHFHWILLKSRTTYKEIRYAKNSPKFITLKLSHTRFFRSQWCSTSDVQDIIAVLSKREWIRRQRNSETGFQNYFFWRLRCCKPRIRSRDPKIRRSISSANALLCQGPFHCSRKCCRLFGGFWKTFSHSRFRKQRLCKGKFPPNIGLIENWRFFRHWKHIYWSFHLCLVFPKHRLLPFIIIYYAIVWENRSSV